MKGMLDRRRLSLALVALAMILAPASYARADETDNFTCAARLTRDSLAALDALMNARIAGAIERANRRKACDAACLIHELQEYVGDSTPDRVTWIPHSKFLGSVRKDSGIERCHLKFKDTIYGAKPVNQPWLLPFYGRIIFVADSILVAGHVVGLDKVDHFIREGLDHWKRVHEKGSEISASVAVEVGRPGGALKWTEYGLKGASLTGVFAYADLAAGYYGYQFWSDLLSIDQPRAYVGSSGGGRYRQLRPFTFAPYVNAAWDERMNASTFEAKLEQDVGKVFRERSIDKPARDCASLAGLPDARLYVNPICLAIEPESPARRTAAQAQRRPPAARSCCPYQPRTSACPSCRWTAVRPSQGTT